MLGGFRSIDYWLEAQRAQLNPIPVSDEFVFVGLDAQSLQKVGQWPWPRSVHAEILTRLDQLGAREVAVDIDFSLASNEEQDAALEKALAEAQMSVIMPIFVQSASLHQDETEFLVSSPLPRFERHSWLAAVNVLADDDGRVRRFPLEFALEGENIPSMPLMLSGVSKPEAESIRLNLSLQPESIKSISAIDVLEGRVEASDIVGKSVVYGAQAVELRDNFAVPGHGTLAGPIVQLLVAETLFQDLVPSDAPFWLYYIPLALIVAAALQVARKANTIWRLAGLLIVASAIEIAAFYLHSLYAVQMATAPVLFFLAVAGGLSALLEIDFQRLRILLVGTEKKNSEQLLDRIIEDNICGVLVIDDAGFIVRHNLQARKMLGLFIDRTETPPAEDLLPQAILRGTSAVLSDDNYTPPTSPLGFTVGIGENKRTFEFGVNVSHLKVVRDKMGNTDSKPVTCVTIWDVTEREAHQKYIADLARYDQVTGSLRRGPFNDEVRAVASSSEPYTLAVLNLHRFKTINVTLGRDLGDDVLRVVSKRLESFSTRVLAVARFQSDEFALLLEGRIDQAEAHRLCERITSSVIEPINIGQAVIHLGVRIGAVTSDRIIGALDPVSCAEAALDEARKIQGNTHVVYEPVFAERQDYLRLAENDLWEAIDRNEICLAYQPQIDLREDRLIGAEALLRWNHPKLGQVSPADFVAIAEANGFIDKLGEWVLNKACQDALQLPDFAKVAVNVSPTQLLRTNVPAQVERALRRTGLPASRLHLEITEVGLVDASGRMIDDLNKLRDMGVVLALDDFGTGFASVSYLSTFPIQKIKVDQMFVRHLERGSDDEAIIGSIGLLARGLGLELLCEGVETYEQMQILLELGVHQGQGYLFGRPEPLEQLIAHCTQPEKLRA